MKKGKANVKRIRSILSTILTMVLLVGNLSLANMDVKAANMEDTGETVSFTQEDGVEILEAEIVEKDELFTEITPYTMLGQCKISVSGDSEGMHIDISTGAVGKASTIGVKDVKIYKKNLFGGWELVATSDGGESYNRTITGVSILYRNAVKGATYKITCIHYADVDGYEECDNDSGSFIFTY